MRLSPFCKRSRMPNCGSYSRCFRAELGWKQGKIAKEEQNILAAQVRVLQVKLSIELELRQVYDRYRTNQRIVENCKKQYLE